MPAEIAPVASPRPSTARRGGMFRALSHRNYRLFWTGAFLSNVGTWMQAVAQGWLVLQLTNSPFWLGLDAFMATSPAFIFTLLGGVFADRIDRRRLLLYTQVVAGLAALALAALVATHVVNRWMVLGFSFVTGCCMSLASPSYLALTYDLVGREDLANAIALNSTQFQLSRVVGPTFAGVAFRLFGLAGCFFANGLSYIAVVAALWMVRMERHANAMAQSEKRRAIWRDLVEGLRYARNRPRVSSLLLLSAVNSLFGAPYFTLVPIYARDIFHLGETGLALLMGTAGGGALCGALLVAYLGDFRRKGWFVLGGGILFGMSIMGFALSSRLMLSLLFLFGVGFAIVCSVSITNTLLQKLVTDEMRGRVMSMFLLSFLGTMPIGALIAGSASTHFGPQPTLAVGGFVVMTVATGVIIFNRRLRELY
ncbi:MAG TPA: MFS transporter [Pyrinomonadaceae bacterium]|nr:MFS transporter [Pyrinomonadaceae bacterium]